MRKHAAYGLVPRDGSLLALKLRSEGGGYDYRVEFCEEISTGQASSGLLRELSRAGRRLLLLLPNDGAHILQARLPELKARELRQALLGLIQKYRGMGEGGWALDAHMRSGSAGLDAGDERCNYTGLFFDLGRLARILADPAVRAARPQRALPAALALEALLRRELMAQDATLNGAWNLVYLGREESFLTVGDVRGPLFIRELPRDLSGGADREEYVRRLCTEVERSNFFARQGEQSVQVTRVLIAGDPDLAAPLLSEMQTVDGVESREWRPEERFAFADRPAPWTLLLPLAAAAVAADSHLFNLIQKRAQDRPARRLKAHGRLVGASVLLTLLPLLAGGSLLTLRIQQRTLAAQQVQLEHARLAAQESARDYLLRRSLLSRQEHVAAMSGSAAQDLGDLLRDVAVRMPPGVRLRSLSLDRTARGAYQLVLSGECVANRSQAAQSQFLALRSALAQSPYLAGAEAPSRLRIGEDDEHSGDSQVAFALEYSVGGKGAKVSPDKRSILPGKRWLVPLAGAAWLILFLLLAWPALKSSRAGDRRIAELSRRAEGLSEWLAIAPASRGAVARWDARLAERFDTLFPPANESSLQDLFYGLTRIAGDVGIDPIHIAVDESPRRPAPRAAGVPDPQAAALMNKLGIRRADLPGDTLAPEVIKVGFASSFEGLARFLDALPSIPRALNVKSLDVGKSQTGIAVELELEYYVQTR